LCCITFSGIIAPEGCHSGGAEAWTCRSPKSVKKNIVRISHENSIIQEISGSTHPVNAITLRRPRRDAPAALQLPQILPTASKKGL